MINKISTILANPKPDFIYDLLPRFQPTLCIDIGAAAGSASSRMNTALGPDGLIVAFEPFPGNIPFLKQRAKTIGHLKVVEAAVSDHRGEETFVVAHTVQGNEKSWGHMPGYSSVGTLISSWSRTITQLPAEKWLRDFANRTLALLRDQKTLRITVPTTTLDHEFAGSHIDFVKMDVQGSEGRVLAGASRLLTEQAIDLLYIEWGGEPAVLENLRKRGYYVLDSTYLCSSLTLQPEQLEGFGFEILNEADLSTGQKAYHLLLKGERKPEEVVAEINKYAKTWIQTDLIAVVASKKEEFLELLSQHAEPDHKTLA